MSSILTLGDVSFPDYSSRPKPELSAPWIQLTPDGEINAYDFTGLQNASTLFLGTAFKELNLTFPDTTNAFGLCYQWTGRTAHLILPKCVSLYMLFQQTDYCNSINVEAAVATDAPYFAYGTAAQSAELHAPNVTNLDHAFTNSKQLRTLLIEAPNAVAITYMLSGCSFLESIEFDFPNAVNGAQFASNCSNLNACTMTWPRISDLSGAFDGTGLESDALNSIFESLPSYESGTHAIGIKGTPGAEACDVSIAEQKGWTVVK